MVDYGVQYGGTPMGKRLDRYANYRNALLWNYDHKRKPESNAQLPLIVPVDLYHLNKHSIDDNWFFDGLHTQKDWVFIQQTSVCQNEMIVGQIRKILKTIVGFFNIEYVKYNSFTQENKDALLLDLSKNLIDLFHKKNWVCVARKMVPQDLDLDILNTLVVWQAAKLESTAFYLRTIDDMATPLYTALLSEKPIKLSAAVKVSDILFVEIKPKDGIQGKSLQAFTLRNESLVRPSVALFKKYLLDDENSLRPIYAGGFFLGEDFIAATFLGARLIQLYNPEAQGNLCFAHGEYFGGLTDIHDESHIIVDGELSRNIKFFDKKIMLEIFQRRMKIAALIANTYARISYNVGDRNKKMYYSEGAHMIIDTPFLCNEVFRFQTPWNKHIANKQEENMFYFKYLLAEMIYTISGKYPNIADISVSAEAERTTLEYVTIMTLITAKIFMGRETLRLQFDLNKANDIFDFLDHMGEQYRAIEIFFGMPNRC